MRHSLGGGRYHMNSYDVCPDHAGIRQWGTLASVPTWLITVCPVSASINTSISQTPFMSDRSRVIFTTISFVLHHSDRDDYVPARSNNRVILWMLTDSYSMGCS